MYSFVCFFGYWKHMHLEGHVNINFCLENVMTGSLDFLMSTTPVCLGNAAGSAPDHHGMSTTIKRAVIFSLVEGLAFN